MQIGDICALGGARKVGASGYAGELKSSEVWRYLAENKSGFIVDVRTEAEWNNVGVVDIKGLSHNVIYLSWRFFPDMQLNPAFVSDLMECMQDRDVPLFFLCRSGARSYEAATIMAEQGYRYCFNIAGGFEAIDDDMGHVDGWKAEGLPWVQV
jgi:rhodanese-related sulfurtransferase